MTTRRLRVLHLITHIAVGGATETVLDLCRLHDSSRFDVTLLHGPTPHDEKGMETIADEMGIARRVAPRLRRDIHPLHDGRAFTELVKVLKAEPWDIVHTHTAKAGILGRLAATRAHVPLVFHTVYSWSYNEHTSARMRPLYVAAERQAARFTDTMVVVSDSNRVKGLRDGIGRAEQYQTVYNCIDIPRFRDVRIDRPALRRALEIPADAPVVGTVSRLAQQKAPGDWVEMARLIHAERPDVHFVFVGGGPLDREFDAAIQNAGLAPVMHNLGYRNDVPILLRAFDIFTLSSLWEGLPLVYAQAMCAALPVVGTNVDGASEIVKHGETGFLTEAQKPEKLAACVLELLDDPARGEAMGKRGLEQVDPKFSAREMTRQMEALYTARAQARGILTGADARKATAA